MADIRGLIEPHASQMDMPPDDQVLLKIMSLDHFEQSLRDSYLYFNRVDRYDDDKCDGEIPRKDRDLAERVTFEKAPKMTLADYYDRSRARTYACCFTMENSPAMWREYGGPGGQDTKVGLEVSFGMLRHLMNEAVGVVLGAETGTTPNSLQLFSVNYGQVKYGEWGDLQLTDQTFQNPVIPFFWKDRRYEREKELRIVLSASGMSRPCFRDRQAFEFPDFLEYPFNLRAALRRGGIALRVDHPHAIGRLTGILSKTGIGSAFAQGSGLPGEPG